MKKGQAMTKSRATIILEESIECYKIMDTRTGLQVGKDYTKERLKIMETEEQRAGRVKREAEKVLISPCVVALAIVENETLQEVIKAGRRGDVETVEKLQRIIQLIEALRVE